MSNRRCAFLFWVLPDEMTPDQVIGLIQEFCSDPKDLTFAVGPHHYRTTDAQWDGKLGAFTASVFKLRESDLPSAIDDDQGVKPLDLSPDTDLGEPIVFAYFPALEAAIVPYSQNGPRHPVIRATLCAMGLDKPIQIGPVLQKNMLERLQDYGIIRSFDLTLAAPEQVKELAALGRPIADTVNIMKELGGINISIRVSMGHATGALTGIKKLAGKVHKYGDTDVSKLKVGASLGEGEPMEQLDLINARISLEFDVSLNSRRELDRPATRQSLLNLFARKRKEIEGKRAAGEHRDD